jgi:hypothetical protein
MPATRARMKIDYKSIELYVGLQSIYYDKQYPSPRLRVVAKHKIGSRRDERAT